MSNGAGPLTAGPGTAAVPPMPAEADPGNEFEEAYRADGESPTAPVIVPGETPGPTAPAAPVKPAPEGTPTAPAAEGEVPGETPAAAAPVEIEFPADWQAGVEPAPIATSPAATPTAPAAGPVGEQPPTVAPLDPEALALAGEVFDLASASEEERPALAAAAEAHARRLQEYVYRAAASTTLAALQAILQGEAGASQARGTAQEVVSALGKAVSAASPDIAAYVGTEVEGQNLLPLAEAVLLRRGIDLSTPQGAARLAALRRDPAGFKALAVAIRAAVEPTAKRLRTAGVVGTPVRPATAGEAPGVTTVTPTGVTRTVARGFGEQPGQQPPTRKATTSEAEDKAIEEEMSRIA